MIWIIHEDQNCWDVSKAQMYPSSFGNMIKFCKGILQGLYLKEKNKKANKASAS